MASDQFDKVSLSHHTPRRFKVIEPVPPQKITRPWKFNKKAARRAVGTKAFFAILIMALTLMFSPYVLVAFLGDDHSFAVRDLANNPKAMRMLQFIVLCKMVGLGAIFTLMPLVKTWFMDEADEGPILSREGEIEEAPTRRKTPVLTLNERALLTHGRLIRGRVLNVSWPKVTVRYKGPWGEGRTAKIKAHAQIEDRPSIGSKIDLLVDPQAPDEVVAPGLLDVTFEHHGPIDDGRADLSKNAQPVKEATLGGRQVADLKSTLHPIQPTFLVSLHRKLRGRRPMSPRVGTLAFGNSRLIQEMESGKAPVSLDLAQPFSAEVSVWLVSDARAEVNLTLRQRGADPSVPALAIRTEVPHGRLSKSLPLKQEQYPYIQPEILDTLWPALQFHAAVHGDDLGGLLETKASPLKEAEASVPSKTVSATAL